MMAGDITFPNATIHVRANIAIHYATPPGVMDLLGQISDGVQQVLSRETDMAHTAAEIKQDLDDTKAVIAQLIGFIQSNDADKAALRKQIADLVAKSNADDATKAQMQADLDGLFDAAEDTENAARAGLPGVPPVGGTPLVPSYADRASFDGAVQAYQGPEAVTLDGSNVKAGTSPSLDYFSHSADGSVSTTGPTD
jgi:hypothetical protein